jgi:hypothetical protein
LPSCGIEEPDMLIGAACKNKRVLSVYRCYSVECHGASGRRRKKEKREGVDVPPAVVVLKTLDLISSLNVPNPYRLVSGCRNDVGRR